MLYIQGYVYVCIYVVCVYKGMYMYVYMYVCVTRVCICMYICCMCYKGMYMYVYNCVCVYKGKPLKSILEAITSCCC